MKSGLILLTICAFTAAMVAKERRAMNPDEEVHREVSSSTTTTSKPPKICDPQTPCAWSTYQVTPAKFIDLNLTNSYCVCGPGTVCQENEDDVAVRAYIYRCRPPVAEEENSEETES
ncbi:uncharacterized protein LOC126371968 [Pectinophora gossypiella]|uniref:uncharacterized protein LOC126371968 n=1 Tax=Pectinophora gossypiella TaxID=13191 RepID=UPI00214DF300|nr:uncharacterized protein LOC126371968 [Pectinophora gossypiella]